MRRQFRNVGIYAVIALGFLASSGSAAEQRVISNFAVEQSEGGTCLVLSSDGPLKYVDFTLPDPDRIVVDCYDTLRRTLMDRLDGPAGSGITDVRVSQYSLEPSLITRAVLELDHRTPYVIRPLETGLVVVLNPVGFVGPGEAPRPLAADVPRLMIAAGQPATGIDEPAGPPPVPQVADDRITLDLQDAEIGTVLRSFSEYAGVSIVPGPEVKGLVTVKVEDIPWRDALEIVLKAHGFSAVEEKGVIRVGGSQAMENEEITRQAAARKKEELLPLETRVFRINFANAEELQEPLRKMLSQRGSIEVEPRTNTILVTDISKNVDKIGSLVHDLDTRTPQVEINAKLVDVDASISRDMGIDWTAFELTVPSVRGEGTAQVSAGLMTPVGSFSIGKVDGPNGSLEATLTMLEKENKASIISNPRITTLDNMEARILVGKKIPLIVSDEAGNPITQLTTIGIQMTVTPHINADGQITLDLHPEVSDLAAQATVQGGIIIVTSEAKARVMVRNGETAVIGGLIRNNETEYTTGVPFLKSLPLVGRLFRSMSTSIEKRELLIFVTPRIVS